MKTSTVIWIIIIVIVVVGGVYWLSTGNTGVSSATAPVITTAPSAAPTLNIGTNAQFASYLTAANGMALYTFKSDTIGVSNCSGSCATAWPPYTVASASGLSAGANVPGAVGTITRSDGTMQVTYNGLPLYFFVSDTNPGDVTGNGQDGFSVAMATPSQAAAQPMIPATAPTAPAQSAPSTSAPAAPAPYTAPGYN